MTWIILLNNKTITTITPKHNKNETKIEKLNKHLQFFMIDIYTFIDKYTNDPMFQITKEEAIFLSNIFEKNGIIIYSQNLLECIQKKYVLLLNDFFGKSQYYYDIILPFLCNDVNYRSHYELTKNGWELLKSNHNILEIINISDEQIFNHCGKYNKYTSKKGKHPIVNFFLRKSDYNEIEKMLDENNKKN